MEIQQLQNEIRDEVLERKLFSEKDGMSPSFFTLDQKWVKRKKIIIKY